MDYELKIEKNPIQVADRLFGILELLAERGEMQLHDIAVEVGLNKTTAHRVLQSLMYLGYVRQEEDGRYSPTLRIAAVADKVVARENLVHIVHPYLRKLMEESGETVHLVRRDGTDAVYIDKIEIEGNTVHMGSQIGGRIALYCSGVGKAICAELGQEEVRNIWEASNITRITPYTITDYDEFVFAIEDVRKRGYALDNEENETGVRCIAASLPPVGGGLYALSISAPVERMDNDRIRVLSAYILAMRKEIEQAMKGE